MKLLLVVNSSASGVTARGRVMIQNKLAASHELTVAETRRRGHATRLAQGALSSGHDVVIALGGDGTLNEVANGLARSRVAMGVLPGGSTNVFARTLGLVNEPVDATDQLLRALDSTPPSIRRVSLGNVNGRYFCFHVGIGYDAAVVATVERHGQMKRWLGHPLFIWAAIHTWTRGFDRKSPLFRIEVPRIGAPATSTTAVLSPDDDETVPFAATSRQHPRHPGAISIDGSFAVVMNTDPYTYLGSKPLRLAPDTTLDSPLSVVVIKKLTVPATSATVIAAMRSQSIAGRRNVEVHSDVQTLRVVGHRPFPWQVDGDYLGDAEELLFRWEPEVLDLVVPDPSSAPSGSGGEASADH